TIFGKLLKAAFHTGLSPDLRQVCTAFDLEARPSAPVQLTSAEIIHCGRSIWSARDDRQILLVHLPQLVFPRNFAALDALDHKLAAQRRAGIRRPDHLADGLGASALYDN